MGILGDIKAAAAKSGANKAKIIYFREGQKVRIRFLTDMDDGIKVTFHDSFERGINCPCRETFGDDCPLCEDDDLRTREQYIWSVYDYDANEVKILMAPVNNCSPIPALVGMYEAYGTLTDRDYVITKNGKQQNTTYSVVPMDKVKFRNTKVKPFSESKIYGILEKAFPFDDEEDDEEKYSKKKKKSAKVKSKKYDDYDEDDYEEADDDEDEVELDYEEMSAKELFELCKERGIKAKPKMKQAYYINLLEEEDEVEEWEDEDEEE